MKNTINFMLLRSAINFYKKQDGFTLIETLVATMILAIGIVTIIQLFTGGLRSVSTSENYSQAIFHAREKMNEILMAESLAEGIVEGTFDDGYQWQAELIEIKGQSDKVNLPISKFSVHLIIQWNQGSRTKKIELNSITIAKLIARDK